ncbi:MAG: PhzF family phenazine biosynthesis protein [Spirochaetales bacterium]|nr:PhzF family phenazine biosynthesis protein [Spirochaetales bacterium]
MNIKLYQIDSFTGTLFSGNPAAVCPLSGDWPPDSLMQHIAMENNCAETAFYIFRDGRYHIRWFTPATEVDLCGHATLAAAYVLFLYEQYEGRELSFDSKSGLLAVRREGDYLTMSFPEDTITAVETSDEIKACFDIEPVETIKGRTDYMLVYRNEEEIRHIFYDLDRIRRIRARGVIITARGNDCDFVSRFFAPQSGIDEDPVTGSAHTTLVPYWSGVLHKDEFTARQLSKRGGFLLCRKKSGVIEISGKAVLYLKGEVSLPDEILNNGKGGKP